jgi:hypothetical protein
VIEDQTEQYETGVIAYARNRSLLPETVLDGYFIYKHDRPNPTPGNMRVNNGAPFPSPSDAATSTPSACAPTARSARAGACAPKAPINGVGSNRQRSERLRLQRPPAVRLRRRAEEPLHADLEYLSGDDPGDGTDQAFDPLWGRWPQWSELMIYQWPLDSRVAQATNLLRLNLGWAAQVHPTSLLTLDYHALFANQESTRTLAQRPISPATGAFAATCSRPGSRPSSMSMSPGIWSPSIWRPVTSTPSHRRDDVLFRACRDGAALVAAPRFALSAYGLRTVEESCQLLLVEYGQMTQERLLAQWR